MADVRSASSFAHHRAICRKGIGGLINSAYSLPIICIGQEMTRRQTRKAGNAHESMPDAGCRRLEEFGLTGAVEAERLHAYFTAKQ